MSRSFILSQTILSNSTDLISTSWENELNDTNTGDTNPPNVSQGHNLQQEQPQSSENTTYNPNQFAELEQQTEQEHRQVPRQDEGAEGGGRGGSGVGEAARARRQGGNPGKRFFGGERGSI